MGEKFRLENAVQKRIRFLRAADKKREPVVLKVRTADALYCTHWDRSLRRDHQLVVDKVLRDNKHMPVCLWGKYGMSKDMTGMMFRIRTKTSILGVGLLDRPNLEIKTSPRHENRTSSAPAALLVVVHNEIEI